MDLLKYGMENRKSSSRIKRGLAEAALALEKARADREERKLSNQAIRIPEDEGENEMLEK
jgi:hypothetical protein